MNKEEVNKYLEEKGDSNFVIRTDEEETTFLANHSKEVEETIIPARISELHGQYDKDILDVTGLKKEPTEKTYDFNKRVLNQYKDKASRADTLEGEIATLREQIKNGITDEQVKKDLERVTDEYNALKETSEKRITDMNTKHDQFKIIAEIRNALAQLSFNDKIPVEAVKALQDAKIAEIAATAKYVDGKLLFLNEDGTPKRNSHNKLDPYTAHELLAEGLKEVIGEGAKPKPNVSDEILKETDDKGQITKLSLIVPDSVTTRSQLGEYLVSKGLLRNTDEYMFAYKEYGSNLPMQ